MIKKKIQYVNWDDEKVTETFHFHLSMPELLELEAEFENVGGLNAYFTRLIEDGKTDKMLAFFKRLILMSYGERSEDGKHFVKSPDVSQAFTQTAAYESLYMELATQDNAAAEFFVGIMPQGLKDRVDADALKQAAHKAATGGEWKLPPSEAVPPPPVIGTPPERPL